MQAPDSRTIFAGLDGRTDTQLPDWYADGTVSADADVVSFAEAIRDLPRAVDTTVAYRNPHTDEWVDTERFNAVVEPSRLREQAQGASDADPLFHVPSDSYTILNPVDVYGPLEDVLETETVDGRALGEVMFGEVRRYRAGGEVHMDVMFDGLEVRLPGRGEPITMGVTTGYDFFGGHAVYVEGFAQDGTCSNTMRQLTERERIKHVGDVVDFEGWWERLLASLELVADDLFAFIRDASRITIDFTDVPFGIEEFYTLCGFPEYLAERAASDAEANADNPFEIDMWTLHSGATYALTHFFKGKEGTALDEYVGIANDVLFNPEATIERVEETYEQQLRAREDGDHSDLDGERGLARIERVRQSVHSDVEQFESREAALRERFEAAVEQ